MYKRSNVEQLKTWLWFRKMSKEKQDYIIEKVARGESIRFAKMLADEKFK